MPHCYSYTRYRYRTLAARSWVDFIRVRPETEAETPCVDAVDGDPQYTTSAVEAIISTRGRNATTLKNRTANLPSLLKHSQ